MAWKPIFYGETRGGRVHFWTRARFDQFIGGLPEGTRVKIIVEEAQLKPSAPMHAFYRGVILPAIAEEVGETVGTMHRILKREFFGKTTSTGKISRRLFVDYIEYCLRQAAWLDVYIPDPSAVLLAAA